MTISAVFRDLTEVNLSLDVIFLDPNNPRFVNENWTIVSDTDIDKDSVQESTLQRMIREFNVDKLKNNMEINGYLPIDRVIVREFTDGKYVVLEGNRRISAAKLLKQLIESDVEYPDHVVQSLQIIPCLQYLGTESNAAWIFQGLRHIAGVFEWSAYSKARLLAQQKEEGDLSLTQVGEIFGLSAHGAGQWIRGYYAFRQASDESDYYREVDERAYPYFQEIFSRSSAPVREWMEWKEDWNNNIFRFENELNFDEFLSWLYPREPPEDERDTSDVLGDWEGRELVRRDDIRNVAYLITHAPKEFQQFRQELNLEKAYAMAQARKAEEQIARQSDPANELLEVAEECARRLENAPLRMLREAAMRDKLFNLLERLEAAIQLIRGQ